MKTENETLSLKGEFLVAMPGISDLRFSGSVIYICEHNKEGAMGLTINMISKVMNFKTLLFDLNIKASDPKISFQILSGGPIEASRGFVLHSMDYKNKDTMEINEEVGLTTSLEIIEDIAINKGPENTILTLGYTGWGPNQLENEIQNNTWLNIKADSNLLFHKKPEFIREKILGTVGIDISLLSTNAGHA